MNLDLTTNFAALSSWEQGRLELDRIFATLQNQFRSTPGVFYHAAQVELPSRQAGDLFADFSDDPDFPMIKVSASDDGELITLGATLNGDDDNHGELGGGALHEVATTAEHGFMSSTDKTSLDAIAVIVAAATYNNTPSTIVKRNGSGDIQGQILLANGQLQSEASLAIRSPATSGSPMLQVVGQRGGSIKNRLSPNIAAPTIAGDYYGDGSSWDGGTGAWSAARQRQYIADLRVYLIDIGERVDKIITRLRSGSGHGLIHPRTTDDDFFN